MYQFFLTNLSLNDLNACLICFLALIYLDIKCYTLLLKLFQTIFDFFV